MSCENKTVNPSFDLVKRADEIMDNSTCWHSLEDEVLKLIVLFSHCTSNLQKDGVDYLTRDYVMEKVLRLKERIPLILDRNGKRAYASFKLVEEAHKKTEGEQ